MPAWDPRYLVGVCFAVALMSGLNHQTFRRERMWSSELLRYVAPELLLVLVLVRIATTLSFGGMTLIEDGLRWFYDPLRIFDDWMLAGLVVGVLVGITAHLAAHNLAELAPTSSDIPMADDQGVARLVSEDRSLALARISQRFIFGGVALLLALALEVVNIQRIASPSLPLSDLSAAASLCYLVSGLLLYSQARLALLQTRWQLDGAHVAEGVARRWTGASWLLVGGIALLALVLPRSYAMGLLDTLQTALGLLGYGITVVGYVLIWILSLLALLPAWLLTLLAPQTMPRGESAGLPLLNTPPPPQVVHQPQFVPALLFWICMLLLLGYALTIVARRYPLPFRVLFSYGRLNVLRAWLLARWSSARGWSQVVTERVRQRVQEQAAVRRRHGRLRLGRLGPRDLVRYFYRSVLLRAAAQGWARRNGQTPYEYADQLARDLPETQADLRELTDVFVAARYSGQAISVEEARRARRPWERLRRVLRDAGRRS